MLRFLLMIWLAPLVVLLGSRFGSGAEPPAELADVHAGLVCWIEPTSAASLRALASRDGVVVYATVSSPQSYRALLREFQESGLLGRSLYIAIRDGRTELPFPDHFVDLTIAPADSDRKEMLRVTSPQRGRVVFGSEILMPVRPATMDDWTHRLHGPDNNPASKDVAFQGPPFLRYLSTPLQTSFQGGLLAAGGRRFELSDWATKKPDRNDVAGGLRARSLFNGLLLWERQLPRQIEPDMPICAVDDDYVYLADDSAPRVLRIDAETGADVEPIIVSDDPGQRVNWLGLEDGRLYALLGGPLQVRSAFEFIGGRNQQNRADQFKSGDTIVSWDLASRRALWRHTEPSTIDYRTIAIRDGRTYLYSEGRRLLCLGSDGKPAWENAETAVIAKLRRPRIKANINTEATSTLMVGSGGVLRVAMPSGGTSLMVSTENGQVLWENPLKYPKCVFLDEGFLTPAGLFDLRTGEKRADAAVEGSGCGILTWVPGLKTALSHVSMGVKSPCGVGTFAAGGLLHFAPSQCDCWPHVRGGAGFGSGGAIIARASDRAEHPLVSRSGPAGPGPAVQAAARGQEGWSQYRGDLTHSGFAGRDHVPTGSKLAASEPPFVVPPGHDMHRMEWLDRPTPPVTAGSLAIYGGSDGRVRAIDTATAKTAWDYWTESAVLTAPSIASDRLYVASCDGWVHCLNVVDGSLNWKWRGAPADSLVSIYGRLMSGWPVVSVLAHAGRVYGVAGMWMQNGSVTFCLDGETGQPIWTRWTPPFYEARETAIREEYGFGPCGYLTIVGQHLWVRGHVGLPGMFHIEDGRRIPLDENFQKMAKDGWNLGFRTASAGQDIVVLDGHTVLQGGTPLISNPDMRHDKSSAKYVAWLTDDDGRITGEPLPQWAIPHSQIAPAVDEREVAVVGGVGKDGRSANSTVGLSLWNRETWKAAYSGTKADAVAAETDISEPVAATTGPGSVAEHAKSQIRNFKTTLDMSQAVWRIDAIDVNALLMTPSTVVVAHGDRSFKPREPVQFSSWSLSGYDRATGKRAWSLPLAGEPVFNGLAPTPTGYVVTLRDGGMEVFSSPDGQGQERGR